MQLFRTLCLLAAAALPIHAAKITSKYVTSSDGSQIFAQAAGDKSQPHIVLVHGLGLSSTVFESILSGSKLTSKAYVVAYDTRGHGRSVKPTSPAGHNSSLYAADFAAVSKAFGLVKPVYVGWSLGGFTVSDIVEHIKPNPLGGVVYLNSLPTLSEVATQTTPLLGSLYAGFTTTDNATLSKSTFVAYTESLFNDASAVPYSVFTSWLGQTAVQMPEQTALVLSRAQNNTDLIAAGQAGLPALFLFGTNDRTAIGEKIYPFLQTWYKNIKADWIQGGSHASFYDNQTYVENSLARFAKEVTRRR